MKKVFAKKSFGQNFLVDQHYVAKIISALNPQIGETVIEIGPGRGALTEKLLQAKANVIAIELERDMIAVLNEKFGTAENFRLIESDALKVNFRELTGNKQSKIKLVANLPYYISTAILQKLIDEREVFSEMILMFQREVVERITAQPGNSERGFLSVLVETYLNAEKLFDVPPTAFRPAPKVWSAVAKITSMNGYSSDNKDSCDYDENIAPFLFKAILSRGFEKKRKTIFNNLKDFTFGKKTFNSSEIREILQLVGIEPQRRAESVTLKEWKNLASNLSAIIN